MKVERIAYAATHRFTAPVIDHLNDAPFIREFLQLPPDEEGLRGAAAARHFTAEDRTVLSSALERQHQRVQMHPAVRANLDRLREQECLTVTTGHQLCLFTGPLYVPYKILNTIRLARQAETILQRPVVPVFWMATEDHDAAEIDHATVNGRTVRWTGAGGGPVGRMQLDGIQDVVEETIALLGPGEHVGRVAESLLAAYAEGRTLTEATRQFVYDLFGHMGLVILDGDDPELKGLFAPVMEQEVLNNVAQRSVAYADERIKERYSVQAHAREINVFHLRPGHRSRIVPDGDHFQVLDGGPRWTLDELLNAIRTDPKSFSPNVLLRPVYQELVLPNIAYIGGGGELAYWLQLRWLFQALQVPMPVVFLRTSAATISAKHLRQWQEMGLSTTDLFAPQDGLKASVAARNASFRTELSTERAAMEELYGALLAEAVKGDASLRGAVEARKAQALRGLDRLEKGMVRAAKRDQQVLLQRMQVIYDAVFPGGGLQERRDNILPRIAAEGLAALDNLLAQLDPLDKRFALIVEG